jgi:hypothetical protein
MWRNRKRFWDELWTALLAYALLLLPIAIAYLVSLHVFTGLGPRPLQLCLPFVLIVPGVAVLRLLRAPESIVYALLTSAGITAWCLMAACFTATTGYTFNKYNPHSVPRIFALNYIYLALLAGGIATLAGVYYQRCLRNSDG